MKKAFFAPLVICAGMSTPAGAQTNDPNPAMNNPDKISWELFVQVSRPGGVPGKTDVVFETWASNDDTFMPNPVFPGASSPPTCGPAPVVVAAAPATPPAASSKILKVPALIALAPRPPGIQPHVTAGGGEEVRRNKATFDFIYCNKLFTRAGLRDAFAAGKAISFPIDSIEVKANWIPADTVQQSLYYVNTASDQKKYALVAVHIISKQVPNWTWATSEHKSNKGRCDYIGCRDNFGAADKDVKPSASPGGAYPDCAKTPALKKMFSEAGMPNLWENYCLKGSQVDFITSTGMPTRLGNSVTEDGFVDTSSCLTCHGRASVSSTGQNPYGGGFISSPNSLICPGGNLRPCSPNGPPNAAWFWTNPSQPNPGMLSFQTDFIWSIPREAIGP